MCHTCLQVAERHLHCQRVGGMPEKKSLLPHHVLSTVTGFPKAEAFPFSTPVKYTQAS